MSATPHPQTDGDEFCTVTHEGKTYRHTRRFFEAMIVAGVLPASALGESTPSKSAPPLPPSFPDTPQKDRTWFTPAKVMLTVIGVVVVIVVLVVVIKKANKTSSWSARKKAIATPTTTVISSSSATTTLLRINQEEVDDRVKELRTDTRRWKNNFQDQWPKILERVHAGELTAEQGDLEEKKLVDKLNGDLEAVKFALLVTLKNFDDEKISTQQLNEIFEAAEIEKKGTEIWSEFRDKSTKFSQSKDEKSTPSDDTLNAIRSDVVDAHLRGFQERVKADIWERERQRMAQRIQSLTSASPKVIQVSLPPPTVMVLNKNDGKYYPASNNSPASSSLNHSSTLANTTNGDSTLYKAADGRVYRVSNSDYQRLLSKKHSLDLQQQSIKQTKSNLTALSDEIKQLSRTLDDTNQTEIDAYNAKVEGYNRVLEFCERLINSYNRDVDAFNAELERVGRLVR